MTYSTIEITAFAEADLLSGGDTNLGCGDTFTMPAGASLCISVTDNDSKLSSDCRDQARDHSGQHAAIEDASGTDIGNGGQIYAESYLRVKDAAGNSYILIEIEQEGSNSDYFTFYTGQGYTVPPAGTELTVHSYCNVGSIPYSCLDAGPKLPSTGTISGTAWCDVDCDGIQDGTTTVEKGANIFTDSVTFESVACTTYNVSKYGSWYSVGARVIDLVVGNAQGHHGNPHDNTLVELDKGGVWCRQFDVAQAGTFCLVLDVFKNSCISTANNAFKIKINGQTVETVTVNADGTIEVELDLAAGHNRIDFVSLSGVSGYGAGIDNIKLQPLTEVTTLTEPVKEGMVVKLLNADGTAVLDGNGQPITTTTDANGNYAFENVPVGDYKVMGVAPDGTEFTIQGAGSSRERDSDVDGTGTSGTISVAAGQTTDVDLGLKEVKPGSLSGKYFNDANRDGLDNDGANGISGIVVELLDENGVGTGTTVTTGTDGSYSFTGLMPGTYGVKFTDPNTGRELTTQNANGNANDDIDSDAGDIGGGMSTITGITVTAGADTPDNDAGVVAKPGAISGTYFCDEDGDDLDDGAANGDKDVANKLVTLLNADGSPATDITGTAIAAVRTDANGDYSFTNLAAGDYVV